MSNTHLLPPHSDDCPSTRRSHESGTFRSERPGPGIHKIEIEIIRVRFELARNEQQTELSIRRAIEMCGELRRTGT